MSHHTQHRMTDIDQLLEHAERHLQQLHELRIQQDVLLQQTHEKLTTTRHTLALSKLLLQEIDEQITHLHQIIDHSDI